MNCDTFPIATGLDTASDAARDEPRLECGWLDDANRTSSMTHEWRGSYSVTILMDNLAIFCCSQLE